MHLLVHPLFHFSSHFSRVDMFRLVKKRIVNVEISKQFICSNSDFV